MPKDRNLRRIDTRPPVVFGVVTAASSSVSNPAPPAFAETPVPTDLALTTALYRSAVTPMALIGATWTPPPGYVALTYAVQWSTDSTFATDVAGTEARQPSATIENLKTNTLYYVRVAAVYRGLQSAWTAAASITTAVDTTPPAVVTSPAAAFINGGDLVVTWTNPASANFRDVEVSIYASNGGALLAQVFDATGRYVWTTRQNLAATSNVGDPSLYTTLRSRSWGGIFSTLVNTGLVTKSAPAAPTISLTGGYSVLVCQVTSAAESVYSLFEYVWKRDGSTQRTKETASRDDVYETGAAGDEGSHSWTVVVRQKDAFGQYSSTTTSSAVVLDTLTIAYLRSGAFYSDDIGSTFVPPAGGALAALKDDDRAAGGISYAA